MDTLLSPDTRSIPSSEHSLGLRLYRRMQLLRIFEVRAGELCRKGEMPSFLHLYVGEEAVAVGVCDLLTQADVITSTHRGHGHALAKGLEPRQLMAEFRRAQPGAIIIMHANGRGWHTAETLPQMLQWLRRHDLTPVTLAELVAAGEPAAVQPPR